MELLDIRDKYGKKLRRYIAWDDAIIDVWLFQSKAKISEVVLQPRETVDAMWATSDLIKELRKSGMFLNRLRLPYLEELLQTYGVETKV
ncbi:MAG: hypothetical protein FWE90_00085 [Defluviitaleaceae bacterium]|nr:hypothetical protein [Defluviitaleaceae bacterium]